MPCAWNHIESCKYRPAYLIGGLLSHLPVSGLRGMAGSTSRMRQPGTSAVLSLRPHLPGANKPHEPGRSHAELAKLLVDNRHQFVKRRLVPLPHSFRRRVTHCRSGGFPVICVPGRTQIPLGVSGAAWKSVVRPNRADVGDANQDSVHKRAQDRPPDR